MFVCKKIIRVMGKFSGYECTGKSNHLEKSFTDSCCSNTSMPSSSPRSSLVSAEERMKNRVREGKENVQHSFFK